MKSNHFTFFIFHTFFLLQTFYSFATGTIEGVVRNQDGEILPFTSISIEKSTIATMANEEGNFLLSLPAGTHVIKFQHIGYQSFVKKIDLSDNQTISLEIRLEKSVIQLGEVKVNNSNEDPALTIIRKTVAMSSIHHKELQSYSLKNYVRAAIRVDKVPLLLKKQLKDNFVKLGQTYVLESIKQITFRQPSSYTEKVVSVRSNIPPHFQGSESISFNLENMYDPRNEISPITPKGASRYTYEYIGYFEDNGLIINKIKIKPRIQGRDLWDGVIHIIDGSWYIHSLDVRVNNGSGDIYYKTIYAPIQGIWLPVQSDFSAKVSTFGFSLTTKATTSFRDYKIQINPRFHQSKPVLIDEKIAKSEAKEVREKNRANGKKLSEEMTLKEFKRFVQETKRQETPRGEVQITERNTSEDSLARKRDEQYWQTERMVPLTDLEVKGYQEADSIYARLEDKIKQRIQKDSVVRAGGAPFKWNHLLVGHTYRYQKLYPEKRNSLFRHSFTFGGWQTNSRYTAVEGFNWQLPKIGYIHTQDTLRSWSSEVQLAYAFAKNQLNGEMRNQFTSKYGRFSWQIGRRITQINPVVPDALGSFYTFWLNRSENKFYQETFQEFSFFRRISPQLSTDFKAYIGRRAPLENSINSSFFNPTSEGIFSSNHPQNQVFGEATTAFAAHTFGRITSVVSYQPNVQIYRTNNREYRRNLGPTYQFTYQAGFGENGFQRIELMAKQAISIPRFTLNWQATAGTFVGKKPTYFLDFRHFDGNELLIQTHTKFRALPFYQYSTNGHYLEGFLDVEFPKFFLTQLPFIQKKKIQETWMFNILKTKELSYYMETGYGLQIPAPEIRVEGFRSWSAADSARWGVRVHLPIR